MNINDGLKAVAYALLVLFFVMGVVKTCGSFTELRRPEMALKCFVRFVVAQAAVESGMELLQRGAGRHLHHHEFLRPVRCVGNGTAR